MSGLWSSSALVPLILGIAVLVIAAVVLRSHAFSREDDVLEIEELLLRRGKRLVRMRESGRGFVLLAGQASSWARVYDVTADDQYGRRTTSMIVIDPVRTVRLRIWAAGGWRDAL